ncbi:MAG TPA: hypothetical protein VGM10_12325 [Actinocrinis sp.]|jgi:hypothetical protein
MLLRLRLWVADRPGALGQVTRELGGCGADIVQVSVLGRERGRALDEITVFLPEGGLRDRLERSLRAMPAVSVEGVRACGEVPGAFPDLHLLGRVAAEPRSTLETLVEALPRILAADWAMALRRQPAADASAAAKGLVGVAAGVPVGTAAARAAEPAEAAPEPAPEILARSWGAPGSADLPGLPAAPVALSAGSTRYAVAPVVPAGDAGPGPVNPGSPQILLCRIGDPAFHRFEVMRLARLCEVAAAIAGPRLVPARSGASVRQLTPP